MSQRRAEMIGSTIRKELMGVIMRELSDPRLMGMPSITRVKVSDDYEYADIYVTIMGTPGQQSAALNALKHSSGLMRTRLTKTLAIRQAPFLRFHIDEALKKELEILELIQKAKREADEAERIRAGLPPVEEDAVEADPDEKEKPPELQPGDAE